MNQGRRFQGIESADESCQESHRQADGANERLLDSRTVADREARAVTRKASPLRTPNPTGGSGACTGA